MKSVLLLLAFFISLPSFGQQTYSKSALIAARITDAILSSTSSGTITSAVFEDIEKPTYDTTKGIIIYYVGEAQEIEPGIRVDSIWHDAWLNENLKLPILVSAEYFGDLDLKKYYQFIPDSQLQDGRMKRKLSKK